MQTKCPNCETVFRLTDEQLTVAHGKVRCGLCNSIFTAFIITEELTPLSEDPANSEHSSNDEILSKIKEFTEKETTDESQEILFDDTDNTFLPDEYYDYGEQETNTTLSTGLWSLGIVFLVTALVSEYVWFNRNQLVRNPDLEPWISQFCETTGCSIDPIHKPELIEMVNRNVYTHPNIKKALMISATMVNTAPHAQAYPDVEIAFSNLRGELVTKRIFTPEEYMKMDEEHLRLLKPDTPTSFGLEIKDPGKNAMTYEFNFL